MNSGASKESTQTGGLITENGSCDWFYQSRPRGAGFTKGSTTRYPKKVLLTRTRVFAVLNGYRSHALGGWPNKSDTIFAPSWVLFDFS